MNQQRPPREQSHLSSAERISMRRKTTRNLGVDSQDQLFKRGIHKNSYHLA
jgi:hypothetical protein